MKRVFLFLTLIVTLLSACAVPVPVETEDPALPTATEPVGVPTEVVPVPKLPAVSFESQTYIDETSGFALDYPADWTVTDAMVGERGSQVQFLSSPDLANLESLPEGATRVSATIYQWDPKNDLAAYVATRKTAWEASGFTILEEGELILEQGLPAVQFTIQTPGGIALFLFTALGDQYLVLSGEGDLELVKEIVQHVRPISVK
ncbi:MAG TPA: hypothetical protein VFQ13_16645 [Anaerolineales bacterium]|nr:hypothetical protein [Anaerolineales bacterium]